MRYATVLDRIIAQEEFREIIGAMTPMQLLHAYLRSIGLNDPEIAELLHRTRSDISQTRANARRLITQRKPHLGPLLEGRTIRHRYRKPTKPED